VRVHPLDETLLRLTLRTNESRAIVVPEPNQTWALRTSWSSDTECVVVRVSGETMCFRNAQRVQPLSNSRAQ
jgi:RNase P/RNase MRP subunit p29